MKNSKNIKGFLVNEFNQKTLYTLIDKITEAKDFDVEKKEELSLEYIHNIFIDALKRDLNRNDLMKINKQKQDEIDAEINESKNKINTLFK